MDVLVTGASGFVGSNLCKSLAESGYRVHAFYRPRMGNEIPTLLAGIDLIHHTGDITDFESVSSAIQGVELVFHTAAKLGSSGPLEVLHAVTVDGTTHVLNAAKKHFVERVIYTSSVAALGVPGWGMPGNEIPQPIDENHTWNFKPEWWHYGYAKHLAEKQVQKAVAEGLEVVIVNPAVVMGAGDINRVGGEILFQLSRRKFPFSLPGGLNIVHVRDVVRGHIAAMKEGRSGERYILAGENLTHLHFHQTIAKILKVNVPDRVLPAKLMRALAGFFSIFENILPVSSSFLRRAGYYFYYDNRKACRDLQLHQFLSAEKAVYETYEWYRGMNLLN